MTSTRCRGPSEFQMLMGGENRTLLAGGLPSVAHRCSMNCMFTCAYAPRDDQSEVVTTGTVTMPFFFKILSISTVEISVSWSTFHYRSRAGFRPRAFRKGPGSPASFAAIEPNGPSGSYADLGMVPSR
jgi:hypothetical protein